MTCLPWALTTAGLIVGTTLTPETLHKLLNKALSKHIDEGRGMGYEEAIAILGENNGLTLEEIPHPKPSQFTYYHSPIATADDVAANAALIKTSLDRGTPLIATLPVLGSPRQFALPTHAICIAGYNITEGRMDVQVIDSLRGIHPYSIKELTAQLIEIHNPFLSIRPTTTE